MRLSKRSDWRVARTWPGSDFHKSGSQWLAHWRDGEGGALGVAVGSQFMALPASGGGRAVSPPHTHTWGPGPALCVKVVQPWVCRHRAHRWCSGPHLGACSWERGRGLCFLSNLCTLITACFLTQFSFHVLANSVKQYSLSSLPLIFFGFHLKIDHRDEVWFTMLNASPCSQISHLLLAHRRPCIYCFVLGHITLCLGFMLCICLSFLIGWVAYGHKLGIFQLSPSNLAPYLA